MLVLFLAPIFALNKQVMDGRIRRNILNEVALFPFVKAGTEGLGRQFTAWGLATLLINNAPLKNRIWPTHRF